MLKTTKSFLAVDFGAGTLKLAEFEVTEAGGLRLKQFGIKTLGAEGSQATKRDAVVRKALSELVSELGIKAKPVNVCAPGVDVFSKFVKLPPVEAGKVSQMVQYEAQQNVPFPLQETVWDYQILGTTAGGELEILLVAIKSDVIEGLFKVVDESGLKLQLADVSPASLCNAFRYNYPDVEECCMLLDIGAKTTNVLFFEKGKVFARSIALGANSITQDFVSETKKGWAFAEEFKLKEGFVSLGGAYEEPENPQQAALSKIARQFMTRLHIQVNQTMQFYRGQQGGGMPQRLYLAGGASIMTYTLQFFQEKLNVPVEYFNPFRNVEFDSAVNLEDLSRSAHAMGEVVGLGLRNLAQCPVELNLMPKSTRRLQAFNQKKPYLVATVFCIMLVVFAMGYLFNQLAVEKQATIEKLEEDIKPLEARANRFKNVLKDFKDTRAEADQLAEWMTQRRYWALVFEELRRMLTQTEAAIAQKNKGADTGVWVERFQSFVAPDAASASGAFAPVPGAAPAVAGGPAIPGGMTPEMQARFRRRYGIEAPGGAPAAPTPPPPPEPGAAPVPGADPSVPAAPADPTLPPGVPDAATAAAMAATNGTVTVEFRAIALADSTGNNQNNQIPFELLKEIMASPLTYGHGTNADAKEYHTKLEGTVSPVDEQTGTFTFKLLWRLKNPIKP
jgi:type IV pilus assembly protein PilM